jgi:hypothetical protein
MVGLCAFQLHRFSARCALNGTPPHIAKAQSEHGDGEHFR